MNLFRMSLARAAASLIAMASATGCIIEDPSSHVTVQRSWPAAGVRRLEVQGLNGAIHVEAGAPDRLEMQARVRLPQGSRQKAEEAIRSSMSGSTLRVAAGRERKRSFIVPFFRSRISTIDYTFQVPPAMMVDLTTVNGRIEVAGVNGSVDAESVNGRIEITTPSAEITAQTVNGHIRTEFTQAFRGASLETVNGSIKVAVPPDASIDCDIVQVNGSFHSEIPVAVNSGSSKRSKNASINGGRYPLEVTTVNGSIRLRTKDQ